MNIQYKLMQSCMHQEQRTNSRYMGIYCMLMQSCISHCWNRADSLSTQQTCLLVRYGHSGGVLELSLESHGSDPRQNFCLHS